MASITMKDEGSKLKGPGHEYLISVETARFYRQTRYYWTICRVSKPEELVAWGDAPTQGEAEEAAGHEVAELRAGLSDGGHIAPHQSSNTPSSFVSR